MKVFAFYFCVTLAFILLGPLLFWTTALFAIVPFLVCAALVFLSPVLVTKHFPEKSWVRDLFLAAAIAAWLIFLGGLTRALPLDMPGSEIPLVDEGIQRFLPWIAGIGALCFLAGCFAARDAKTRFWFTLQGVFFAALMVIAVLEYKNDRFYGFFTLGFTPLLLLQYRLWKSQPTLDFEAGIENFGIIPEEEEDFL